MNLVIDAGNSFVKIGIFQQQKLLYKEAIVKEDLLPAITMLHKHYTDIEQAIISSVTAITASKLSALQKTTKLFILDHTARLPFKNKYATPQTLGIDRIALTAAAVAKFPGLDVLVIDAGTCITYDFKNKNEEYLGGAIAPGIELRYKSLHNFTANLPLLSPKAPENITGNSTNEAMNSGVIYGVYYEIEGVISHYCHTYPNLTVILTGGDAHFLSKRLKNTIFANSDFLLEGLNHLLVFNSSQ